MDLSMEFQVDPDSEPRTNIHAIIGRNGVGKGFLLRDMSRSLLFDKRGPELPSIHAFELLVEQQVTCTHQLDLPNAGRGA